MVREGAENNCYLKGIEVILRETVMKSYLEDVDSPTVLSQSNEVRPSRRVLELQNEDLWISLTDLSWHVPIVVNIRELPFKRLSWKVNCEYGSQECRS